jgi:quercetin dioxygenase-like cupin family protein
VIAATVTDEQPIKLPDGTRVVVTRRAADPEREGFELELTIAPDGIASPPHVHPNQTDEFDVVSGRFEVLRGEDWHELSAGDRFVIEPGVVHTYRNRSGEPAVARNVHDPAGSFQEYIDRMGILTREGRLENPRSPRGLLYMAVLWTEHADTMRPARAPLKVGLPVLAAVARLLRVRVPRAS